MYSQQYLTLTSVGQTHSAWCATRSESILVVYVTAVCRCSQPTHKSELHVVLDHVVPTVGSALQVISCLSDSKESIKSQACRKEVTYLEKLEVNDFRTDIVLAEACRADVNKFCLKVEPGEGRVHKCLRAKAAQLSPACR